MKTAQFALLSICLFIISQINSIAYASSFVIIMIDSNVSFELPRNWVVISDNGIATLNSVVESIVSIPSTVRFQANL